MSSRAKRLYRFGDFLLDPGGRVLLHADRPVQLTPKVFDTLLVLVEERDRPVTHEELIRRVWPDTAASKNNLDQNIFLLRKALGASASEQRFIQTVPKVGYRFIAEVSETAGGSPEQGTEHDDKLNNSLAEKSPVTPHTGEQTRTAAGARAGGGGNGWAVSEWRSPGGKIKPRKGQTILFVTASVIVLAGGLYGLGKVMDSFRRQPQTMKISRIAGTEKSTSAAISPDGKYVAHVVADTNQRSLELRQIATNSNVLLIPPASADYFGLTFSRDGDYVYFIRHTNDEPANSLYRIPALGGDAKKVAAGVDSPVSFSPDGRHFAFVRHLHGEGSSLKGTLRESALIVADAETAEERLVRKRIAPQFFSDAGPAWSPDGKIIACSAGVESGRDSRMTVVGVDAADGTERPMTTREWFVVRQVGWLPNGEGLISVAEEMSGWAQVWHLTYPGGEARRITNDLDNYGDVSLAANLDALITTRTENRYNLWVAPREDYRQVKQITFGGDHIYRRVAWTPDGRIVFPSTAMGSREIWVMGADGSGHKQLTFDKGNNLLPSVSPDGRFIVFASDRAGNHNIWRVDIDGGNPKQLTHGEEDWGPRVSPEGQWVLYNSASSGKETLWRVRIDGGEPVQVVDEHVVGPDVSPDGKLIAIWLRQPPLSSRRMAIFPWAGGEPVKVFDALPPRHHHPVRWAADGRGLIYIVTRDGVSNLWLQPVVGGDPKQLTDFKSELIEGFDVSRDGKLVIARGYTARDVVLISDFR